jgi:hypothetical protein
MDASEPPRGRRQRGLVVCGEEEGGGFSGGGGEGMTVERDSGSLVRVRVTLIAGWTAGWGQPVSSHSVVAAGGSRLHRNFRVPL